MNLTVNTSLTVKYPFSQSKQLKPLKIGSINVRPSSSSLKKLPARDRVIDFGKYKGNMLGTLPSNYLKWVSNNLRARDFEEWANLADEVLIDPVYKDRIEWEFAEKILSGNTLSNKASSPVSGDAVSQLLEISERFGWDNGDKVAWGKIDFSLLGTSKGGRLPRAVAESGVKNVEKDERGDGEEEGGRRRERRERIRQRGVLKSSTGSTSSVAGGTTGMSGSGEGLRQERGTLPASSQFPGRDALIKKTQ